MYFIWIMKKLYSLVALLFLIGCAEKQNQALENRSLEEIYKSASKKLHEGDYSGAGEEFLEVDRQYPYSSWASNAMIMSSYCYFLEKKFDEAIRNLEIFTKFNVGNKYIEYAYYLKALCYFRQITSSKKDMEKAEDALNAFRQLMRMFPKSIYTKDARTKVLYINNLMAAHELSVGRFYQGQKNFVAAIPHFQSVIDFYFNTPQMPEAYYRYIESLIALGMFDEATEVFSQMPQIEDRWSKLAKSLVQYFSKTPRYKLTRIK